MIDVAFTPASIRPARVAVVIDVLRASSSMCEALGGGYRRILCCRTVEEAEGLRAAGRVLAGERGGVPPDGFDLGNSPAAFREPRGEEVVLTTTNGCPALLGAAETADEVLLGSLLNLDALLAALDTDDLILVCAGTHEAPALEDVYLAGRIAATLPGDRTDATRVAEAVAQAYPEAGTALAASDDAHELREVGLGSDVEWCARESTLDLVPRLTGLNDGIAVVELAGSTVTTPA